MSPPKDTRHDEIGERQNPFAQENCSYENSENGNQDLEGRLHVTMNLIAQQNSRRCAFDPRNNGAISPRSHRRDLRHSQKPSSAAVAMTVMPRKSHLTGMDDSCPNASDRSHTNVS